MIDNNFFLNIDDNTAFIINYPKNNISTAVKQLIILDPKYFFAITNKKQIIYLNTQTTCRAEYRQYHRVFRPT